jgi:hypothetical protein
MFVEFEKDATVGQTAFAVNVDNVIKIEPSPAQDGPSRRADHRAYLYRWHIRHRPRQSANND